MDLASLRIPFGGSKFPYNEALHFRSSVLESHDDIAQGIKCFYFHPLFLSFKLVCVFFFLGLND